MPSGNEILRPAIVLLSGLPGSGKTTFAAALAERMALQHLESDAVRREIFPKPVYSFAESRVVFREMERRCERALDAGMIALVDATNLLEAHRARFCSIGTRLRVPVIMVRVTAPPESVRARLIRPRTGHSQADITVYESMRGTVEPARCAQITVDSRYPLEPALRLVAEVLEESP